MKSNLIAICGDSARGDDLRAPIAGAFPFGLIYGVRRGEAAAAARGAESIELSQHLSSKFVHKTVSHHLR